MAAIMVVTMSILDEAWIDPYFKAVPPILAEYGARQIAGTRSPTRLEGDGTLPDRVAIFSFPSLDAIERFMADERYQPFRRAREAGAPSDILVFDNQTKGEGLL